MKKYLQSFRVIRVGISIELGNIILMLQNPVDSNVLLSKNVQKFELEESLLFTSHSKWQAKIILSWGTV